MRQFLSVRLDRPNAADVVGGARYLSTWIEASDRSKFAFGKLVPGTLLSEPGGICFALDMQYGAGTYDTPPYSVLTAGTSIPLYEGWPRRDPLISMALVLRRWEEPMRRQDWPSILPPDENSRTPFDCSRRLSQKEFYWLTLGTLPLSNDDHWFSFYENGHLYYHRSATGVCAGEFLIEVSGEGQYSIMDAWYFMVYDSAQSFQDVICAEINLLCQEANRILD